MDHVLDNPAWNALISGNQHLSNGNEQVRFFDKEVSPFVALKEKSTTNFEMLHELIVHDSPLLFVSTVETEIPTMWKVLRTMVGIQMVCNDPVDQATSGNLVPLTDEHIPQMLELTKLTNPGPFAPRTISFGHYMGVFNDEQLVAMAGQRLNPFNYAEVSAVCTHPDYLGRGYAKQLLQSHINRIKAASQIPFLHVRGDNERAISVYKSLGFSARSNVYFYVLQKEK